MRGAEQSAPVFFQYSGVGCGPAGLTSCNRGNSHGLVEGSGLAKQVSLSFLKSAVDLLEAAPTTQPVLERSFDMFFKHYEGAHAPVSVSDLWPHLGSATDKSS